MRRDAFDDFFERIEREEDHTSEPVRKRSPGRENRMTEPGGLTGSVVNLLTVGDLIMRPGWGGKPIGTAKYECRCRCGNQIDVSYHQLYYSNIYSCGCVPVHKHPPVRYEGHAFGRLRVMHWDQILGTWEAVCEECGAVLHCRNRREMEPLASSCDRHSQLDISAAAP